MFSVFNGKNVLVTGHTGFKGSWLSLWLSTLGANVTGVSLSPSTSPSLFDSLNLSSILSHNIVDVTDFPLFSSLLCDLKPDFIFHLAAQPIVSASYENPLLTWQTNVNGTLNLLESLRSFKHSCHVVFITSDKCYENKEWTWGYRETDQLGGSDPYSVSKAAAELVIQTYARSYFQSPDSCVKVSSARAGNVIGGGDWSNNRIVPDCARAWSSGHSVGLRNPYSTRPWQHVLEPLGGYLLLASSLYNGSIASGQSFNFGPPSSQNFTVERLVQEFSKTWSNAIWHIHPSSDSFTHLHESSLLKLCCDKALHQLGWFPVLTFPETVRYTATWYKSFYNSPEESYELSLNQISDYVSSALSLGFPSAL